MADHRVVTEEMLHEAVLGGVPCKAVAFVEVTHVEVPAGERGHTEIVEGIRTWRGTAIVEAAALPGWRLDKTLRYSGPLLDGEDKRHINAEVYIYRTRRLKPPRAAEPPSAANRSGRIYVAFVGAGNQMLHPPG